MDVLIEFVVKKTGIPKDQAKIVVEAILLYFKDNLPDYIAKGLFDWVHYH